MPLALRYAALAALPDRLDRVGLAGALDALDHRARHVPAPGRAVEWGLTWDDRDAADPRWMPQGLTTTADAAAPWRERRIVLAAWYLQDRRGRHLGSRVSVLDLETLRYTHVELARPTRSGLEPLAVHAGGLAWSGDHLLVAATKRGLGVARLDDLARVDGRLVLPVTGWLHAEQDDEEPLRYSSCSVDTSGADPRLLVAEYGRGEQSRRLVALPLGEDGLPLPAGDGRCRGEQLPDVPLRTQGLVSVDGVLHATASNGTHRPGTLHVGEPGRLRAWTGALPPGPEDLAWWPDTGLLWSQTEHPGQRYVVALRPQQ